MTILLVGRTQLQNSGRLANCFVNSLHDTATKLDVNVHIYAQIAWWHRKFATLRSLARIVMIVEPLAT